MSSDLRRDTLTGNSGFSGTRQGFQLQYPYLPSETEKTRVMKDEQLKVEIERDATVTLRPFKDYFRDFEKVEAVKKIFGPETEEVLNKLKVEFFSAKFGYMSVSDEDGHLLISAHHLKNSEFRIL